MTFMISTEGFQLDDTLRERAQALSEKFQERVSDEGRIHMTLARTDKRHVQATVRVHLFQHDFVAHGRDESAIKALNHAMDALTRQAKDHRDKVIDRHHHAPNVAEFVRS